MLVLFSRVTNRQRVYDGPMYVQCDSDARTLWDYMQCQQPVADTNSMLVLGGRDDRVAIYAAELAARREYDLIIVSGGVAGHNPHLKSWKEPTEAAHFLQVMRDHGCAQEVILEEEAQNTGENAHFVHALLRRRNIAMPKTMQIVTKPYMERRALATFEAQWPEPSTSWFVTSPGGSLDEYVSHEHDYEETIQKLVGDLDRIIQYPALGFQSQQDVSDATIEAFERLKHAGYTAYVLKK